MNQLGQLKEKLSFACAKCGVNDYRLEIRAETIITYNVNANSSGSPATSLDTTRTSQAKLAVTCNKCGERWSPA